LEVSIPILLAKQTLSYVQLHQYVLRVRGFKCALQ